VNEQREMRINAFLFSQEIDLVIILEIDMQINMFSEMDENPSINLSKT
jgi:hypothetical protein